ncbi:helix-turn-helix domain-containing protein [Agromyces laixinhei]|uniref:helix-turn-helix domain-containing protein n=1 Tax=Agromyces laixinhei TaxID=2585717 RepID=UPI0012ECE409|nr:helix-turn-helix domain-containing protein [Agromyces laixinhei]
MRYEEQSAPEEWRPFVTRMWFLEAPRERRYEKILPLPFAHAIVNLSSPYRLIDPRGNASVVDEAFVSGIQSEFLLIENPTLIRHVGVEFTPDGLRAFSATPPSDVAGRILSASDVFGDIAGLIARVRAEPAPDAALPALESFLRAARRPDIGADRLVSTILAAMQKHPDARIGDLAAHAGVSHKTVITHFRAACGIAPKHFAEVLRFHRFIVGLPLGDDLPSWADLAAVSPYYDQPHVIRAFRRFSGYTPAEYLRRVAEFGPDAASFVPLEDVPGPPG